MDETKSKRADCRGGGWPLLLAAVITWESVMAVPSVGPPWLSFDKLAHFSVFGLLATAIARMDRAGRWPLLRALWAVILVSLYGMGIEFLQSLTPVRSMEYADWVADTLGAGTAVILYLRWTGYRRLLEWRVGRRPTEGGAVRPVRRAHGRQSTPRQERST